METVMQSIPTSTGVPFIFILIYIVIFLGITLLVAINVFVIMKITELKRKLQRDRE